MRAVEVAREAVTLRGRMQIVQMRGDLGRAEADVIIRQLIVDAADNRAAIAREDRGAWCGRVRRVAGETPDRLRWIRRIENPIRILLGRHLVEEGRAAEAADLTVALVRCPARFARSEIGRFRRGRREGVDGIEPGDRVGQIFLPRRGGGARGDHRRGGLRRALARGQQQRHRHGRSGALQKGPSCVTVCSSCHMHFHPGLSVSSSS